MTVRTITIMITAFFILFAFSSYSYISALPLTQMERSALLHARYPEYGQERTTRGAEPEIPEIPAKEEQHLTIDLSLFVSVTAFLSALTLVFALITKYLVAPTVRDIIREENQQLVMKSTFDEYKLQHQLAHEALERAIEDRK